MIRRIRVANFRSIEEMSLELGPFVVLVGPNGAGKSNIIDVVRFVRDACTIGLDNAVLQRGGMSALRRWSRKGRPYDVRIELDLSIGSWSWTYGFVLGSRKRGEFRVKAECCRGSCGDSFLGFRIKDGRWVEPPHQGKSADGALPLGSGRVGEPADSGRSTQLFLPLAPPNWDPLRRFLREMGFYTIYPNDIREPQKPANPSPLDEHGRNLATVLRRMKQDPSRRRMFERLLETLAAAVEGISDITVIRSGGYLVTKLHYGPGGPSFPLAQESDGALRLLGLLTALYQDPPCSLIAVEEPELTIHPGALAVLRESFQELSELTQVLITTHSVDFLETLSPEVLRVVEKRDGRSLVGRIAAHQRQAIAEKLFSPMELVRIEGLLREEEVGR
jgi:predicted ATPase